MPRRLGRIGVDMKKAFEGYVEMYEEKVYVNTETKEGYARVLERIDPLLCKWSARTYMPGYTFEDIKQELSMIIIEGVNAFDPEKKVKLSTFLHTHLRNKLISKIKSVNKLSNDACSLRNLDDTEDGPSEKMKYRKSREELAFSSMVKIDPGSGEEYSEFQNTLSNADALYSDDGTIFERIDLELAINKIARMIDPKTHTILKMVCLDGFSIKDAAKEVGLTGWAASMRLKKLKKYKIITDLLGDRLNKDE
jgi:RNA polymerase sigma factor (sigma-70 family)